MLNFIIIILTVLTLLADSIGNNTTIYKYLGISSEKILLLSWIYLSYFRFKKGNIFLKIKQINFLKILLLFFIILTICLSIWGYLARPNIVYSITKLHQEQLGILSVYLFGVILLIQNNEWWKKNYKTFIFSIFFISIFFLWIVRLWPMDYFFQIVKEDHLIENLQVIVLLVGVALAIYYLVIKKSFKEFNMINLLICIGIVLTFFLLAGEEISWGQRIFNINTPKYLLEHNVQQETTIHNLSSIHGLVEKFYFGIGLLAVFLFLFREKIKIKSIQNWLNIPWYLIPYFGIQVLYYSYFLFSTENIFKEWSEIIELMILIGLVIYFLNVILNRKNNFR